MNRIYRRFNWPSKVITLVAFVGFTNLQGNAQTTLINDSFSGSYNGLDGSTPDTTDVPLTQWQANNHYGRGINATWSPTGYAGSDYSGNGTVDAGISFAGYGQDIDTLTVNVFKSSTDQGGSPIAFGFNTASTVTPSTAEGTGNNFCGFVLADGGLGVALYSGGNGNLYFNGNSVASWESPLEFTQDAANVLSLSYNDQTNLATVTEGGDLLASFDVGSLSLNSAGIGGSFDHGWNYGSPTPDGFAAFTVTTQAIATAPEPSTWALMLSGAVGLFFIRRLRSHSRG